MSDYNFISVTCEKNGSSLTQPNTIQLFLKSISTVITLFPAHLHSKDEFIREEAALCIENLSRQCSDSTGIKEMIERLFAVLNGNLLLLPFNFN